MFQKAGQGNWCVTMILSFHFISVPAGFKPGPLLGAIWFSFLRLHIRFYTAFSERLYTFDRFFGNVHASCFIYCNSCQLPCQQYWEGWGYERFRWSTGQFKYWFELSKFMFSMNFPETISHESHSSLLGRYAMIFWFFSAPKRVGIQLSLAGVKKYVCSKLCLGLWL